ncbi:FHA domain-containing protein [Catenulispora subtropica]|uniref:FHA domain-containing protein n=1 Tax=Catenulispora subtropica TaxID=450798 RepID=A0ABP5EEK9_9ACTN
MTMATCPDGHQSVATDYCDECGLSIGAPAPIPTTGGSQTTGPTSVYGSAGEPCPNCLLPRQAGDTFCEGCGFDFANEQPAPTMTAPTQQPDPVADLEAELRKAEEAARAPQGPTTTGTDPLARTIASDPPSPARWVAIASADRAYYDAVVAEGEIDPTAYPFPAYCPDRHFTLTGDTVRIGRSGKKGQVEIDLSGPPTDPGVSHLHAVFQQRPDGGWSVVDLESMNGTVLNDDTAPIPPNQAFPVEVGYRVHVGVWTTLTLIQNP